MTANILHNILLLFTFAVLTVLSTSCANQGTQQNKISKYPDETDYKAKKKRPMLSRDNYHAFLDAK